MSNYTKTTNFATKDSLPSGNAAKIVRGTEIDTEFNNIATERQLVLLRLTLLILHLLVL